MRFQDPDEAMEGTTRTAFHRLDADVQLAIEELSHTLASLGYLIEVCLDSFSEIIIRIADQN